MIDRTFTQRLFDQPLETIIDYYAHHLGDAANIFLEANCLSANAGLRVGFADRTLGPQLPPKNNKTGAQLRAHLRTVGILKASGHETLRGFVTVPLTDAEGKTTGIYGLRLDNKGKSKDQPQLTLGSGIFNAVAMTTFEEVIVCANVLDAWTFHAAGHANVIATEGESFNRELFASVKRVLLADPSLEASSFAGVEPMRIHFPEGITVNEYAILNRSIDDALSNRIRAASIIDRGAAVPPASATKKEAPANHANDTNENAVEVVAVTAQPVTTSPLPKPAKDFEVEQSETEVTLRLESRRWRIRGLERNTTSGVLKINLLIFNEQNERFHVDTLDLYHSRSRRVFLKETSEETGLSENELRSDLGRVLLKLEELQEEQRVNGKAEAKPVEISEAERSEAMELLQSENLLDRVLSDFDACGIVGERTGKLAGYLAVTSRLLDKPLGLVIQSSSAAGKSSLADAVLRFMPPEEQFACSAMTSQSLYYLGNENLKHKILSIAEEEGVRDASYQLKLLQSEGHLSLVATSKESGTGRTTTERYEVEGPVALMMTTTALDVDPELMNRCLVVSVDESASADASDSLAATSRPHARRHPASRRAKANRSPSSERAASATSDGDRQFLRRSTGLRCPSSPSPPRPRQVPDVDRYRHVPASTPTRSQASRDQRRRNRLPRSHSP